MRQTIRACAELLALSWRTNRLKLLLAGFLMLLRAVAWPAVAAALAALVTAATRGDVSAAVVAAGLVAVLAIASLTAGHFAHVLYFELGELNFLRMDRQLVDLSNASVGLEHHERPDYADRVQVLKQEMDRVSWTSMEALLSSIGLAVGLAVTGILLAGLSPWLLLLPLAAVPPILTGRWAETVTGRARAESAESTRQSQHLYRIATDTGAGKELRVCGLQEEIRHRHLTLWHAVTRALWRAEVRAAGLRMLGQGFFAVAYLSATLLVVSDVVRNAGDVGDVVLVVTLAAQVNQQVSSAVTLLQELQRLAVTLETYRWVAGLVAPKVPTSAPVAAPDVVRGGIALRDVSFSYPGRDRPVLSGVNLTLPAGTTVAIVGENGAGKSTLVKLLCRFYEPTTGVIEVDGTGLHEIPVDRWRQRISAGFQDFVRYEFVARETVGVGDLPRVSSSSAVTAALARAGADEVLGRLPDGLDTRLGSSWAGGTDLSGGQWQKLALGRAMMRESPLLLVLDEPTAALDAESEHALFERYAAGAARVGEQTGGITVLVSHRFSTVRTADLILVVADGRIAESGNHDQLMATGGRYAELYGLQQAAYR